MMKKIAMFTMGTRGDLEPYLILSKELIRSGFEVTLGSHPIWRDLVETSGARFVPIGPDIDINKETAAIRGVRPHPLRSMLKTMNFVFRIIQDSTHDVYEAAKGMDLVIVTHSLMGAVEAQVLGIPTINVTLQKEMIGEKLRFKTYLQRIMEAVIEAVAARPYNKIRKVYGLKSIRSCDKIMSGRLNLIPISEIVLERNRYWEKKHVQTGYWFDCQESDYQPDEPLRAFLEEGEKPVLLSLGAMSFESRKEKDKLELFVSALEKTGHRAIIQGFQETIKDFALPSGMIASGSIPHSWLFKKCRYVIHHAGYGTTASTLVWGIPSIPVPHMLDQMGFARQLQALGVAVKPLKAAKLTEDALIQAIQEMDRTYLEKRQAACSLSVRLQAEHGVQKAASLIKEVLNC